MADFRPQLGSVLIMAGGTGGHVFPALAVAHELEQLGARPLWLGTKHGLEARVVPEAGYKLLTIAISGLRGKGFLSWLLAPLMLAAALLQSVQIMMSVRPAVVLGLGGYVSAPGGIAAWLLRRPLLIHEQNAVVGTTNRLLAHFAVRVMEGFSGAFAAKYQAIHTGNPVRGEILAIAGKDARRENRAQPVRVLIVGGSQGAAVLNQIVPAALAMLADWPIEVLHQCGKDEADTRNRYRAVGLNADVRAFIDEMSSAYSWADVVIARAGALTLAEITAVGLGSVLVPYPHAIDDHQAVNARILESHGAALVIPQSELHPRRLASELTQLLSDPERLVTMAASARKLGFVWNA
jgi:UDP-N-acetylglucosamine--N-acetylmuramyl-(pentapeptide) pyrophosphoryl-undecaprenol N-acetylglucosamine transferase